MKYIVGVDLGGTKIAAALFDTSLRLLRKMRVATEPREGVDAVIGRIGDSVCALLSAAGALAGEVAGVGIAAPGPLNTRTGVVNSAALLGWQDVPLRDLVFRKVGAPVWLENDAAAAGFGECRHGAGRNASNMVYVTVSTGIGAGIIINRRIYRGRHDSAGEFGHICIDPGGRPCQCGRRGCLQAYASGTSLAEIARERLSACGGPSAMLEMAGGAREGIDALILEQAAMRGDPPAIALWDEMGARLGHGLSILVQLFDPELIVIGGGLSKAWPLFRDSALATIREHTYKMLADDLQVVPSALGDEAGLYGAAALVQEELGLAPPAREQPGDVQIT